MNFSFSAEQPLYAVIVAGGSGSRMQSQLAKQYLPLLGKPILMHTLEVFQQTSPHLQLVLVLPAQDAPYWHALCKSYAFGVKHHLVAGGSSRFQSVRNGLALVPDQALVAIHDGVRPLIDTATIHMAYKLAAEKGSAVVAVPLKDSVRQLTTEGHSESRRREEFCLVQTPQTFQARAIKNAYQQAEESRFTDCASVAEAAGLPIYLTEGTYRNLKITTPEDLLFAEALLKQ